MYWSLSDLPRRVLIDTNVLLDLVLASVAPEDPRDHLASARDAHDVMTYLQSCHRVAITPHVLVEVDRHLMRQRKREALHAARSIAFGLLGAPVFNELWAAAATLDPASVARFGLTDAALVEVALREQLTLFTADAPLDQFARHQGVDVLSVWQILYHPARG